MRRALHLNITHFGEHTEITFKDVSNLGYTLRLYMENEAKALQKKDNQTWTPTQRPLVPYFPTVHTC